jgi:glycosyltransferase involved in cell wall biosynthesis
LYRNNPKPILIDITDLLIQFNSKSFYTGIMRVCLAYVEHYREQAHAAIQWKSYFFILSENISQQLFELLLTSKKSPLVRRKICLLILKGLCTRQQKKRLNSYYLLKIDYAGIGHSTSFTKLKRRGLHFIFMLHDLIPIEHAEFFQEGNKAGHMVIIEKMLTLGRGIITNSQATLDALIAYTSDNGFSLPQTTVALLAPGRSVTPPQSRPILSPYFVVIGTIEPRKNYCFLLQIWQQLIKRLGDKAPRLVIIGKRGWECENVLDLLERCELLRGYVIEKPCSDEEVVTYLYHSQALLFPTFAEGYGMPVVEALSLGIPVIASDLPVFREFAADIPQYLDPLDGKGWLDTIESYTETESILRSQQLNRIKGFRTPTLADHFSKVDVFMKQVIKAEQAF